MSLIWVEGFDHYNSTDDMLQGAWLSADTDGSQFYVEPNGAGRFGGKCLAWTPGATMYSARAARTFTRSISAGFVGGASLVVGTGGTTAAGTEFICQGAVQFGVQLCQGGYIQVVNHLNSYQQTVLGQSPVNSYVGGVWQYIEIGFTLSILNPCTVVVRVGGTQVLALSGVNLLNGVATNATVDTLSFNLGGTATGGLLQSIDDVYVCDDLVGPGPNPFNTFQGDCRVQTMFPNGAGAVTNWVTNSPVTSPTGASTGNSTQGNNQILLPWILPAPGLTMSAPLISPLYNVPLQNSVAITAFTVYADGASTASLIPVIYNYDPTTNSAGTLVASGITNSAIVTGANTLAFSTPVELTAGANYLFGFMIGNANFNLSTSNTYSTSNNATGAYPCTFPTPPNLTGVAPSRAFGNSLPLMSWTGTVVNYESVQESATDMDFTYNATATPGAIDLYTLSNPLPANANVLAVQLTGCYRKDDANAHTLSQVVYSTGVTSPVVPAHQLNASYTYTIDVLPLNPTTSTQWTAAVVNAMQIGVEMVS